MGAEVLLSQLVMMMGVSAPDGVSSQGRVALVRSVTLEMCLQSSDERVGTCWGVITSVALVVSMSAPDGVS